MPDLHLRRLCIVLCVSAGAFSLLFQTIIPLNQLPLSILLLFVHENII
jgi:hypothetical protein